MDKHMDKQHIVDGKEQTKILRCNLLFIADAELCRGTYNLCAKSISTGKNNLSSNIYSVKAAFFSQS